MAKRARTYRHRRNSSLAAVVMLVGSALIAFGSTQSWAGVSVLTDKVDLDWDKTVTSDGSVSNFEPFLLTVSIAVAVCALLLMVTRVRGLGVVWRLISLAFLASFTFVLVLTWQTVNDPALLSKHLPGGGVVQGLGGLITNFFKTTGALSVEPGKGLWLATIGCGLAAVGSLIPAFRSREDLDTATAGATPTYNGYAGPQFHTPPYGPPAGYGQPGFQQTAYPQQRYERAAPTAPPNDGWSNPTLNG